MRKEASRIPMEAGPSPSRSNNPELLKKIEDMKKESPDALAISASREKLEDFFFRTVENANV